MMTAAVRPELGETAHARVIAFISATKRVISAGVSQCLLRRAVAAALKPNAITLSGSKLVGDQL